MSQIQKLSQIQKTAPDVSFLMVSPVQVLHLKQSSKSSPRSYKKSDNLKGKKSTLKKFTYKCILQGGLACVYNLSKQCNFVWCILASTEGRGLAHRESGSHWLLNRTATVIHVSNCPSASPYNWVGKYLFSQSLQYLCNICHPCLQPPLRLSTELGWKIFLYFLQYLLHVHFFCTLPSSFLWVSQCKLMEILYLVHFYIILCKNI